MIDNDGKSNEIEESGFYELTEQSFYPPQDDRTHVSGICDVPDGDTFYEYSEYFWENYENEIFDCNN